MQESYPAASTVNLVSLYEIWGRAPSWIRVKKNRFFQANFEKFRFSRQTFENCRFFKQIFKKFRFFQAIFKLFLIFQAKIAHLQLLLDNLFYFSSEFTTFEHTSCRL